MDKFILVMLGPPGSGKGTQAKFIAKKFGLPQISTGDLLRAAVKSGSELGQLAQEYIDAGNLVPDPVVLKLLKIRISQDDSRPGFILDGYPRNLQQAKDLEKIAEVDLVILIEAEQKTLVKRITGRRTCKKCGAIFHINFNPPKIQGICDICSGELYQRTDDREETVIKRLQTYLRQTKPLIEYYKGLGVLKPIAGDRTIEEIQNELDRIISSRFEKEK
ncbi:MAG: adenylate kinase [Candidatus Heimdallarchaeota archaeon]